MSVKDDIYKLLDCVLTIEFSNFEIEQRVDLKKINTKIRLYSVYKN